jgi:histidine triad (HIT) family protein
MRYNEAMSDNVFAKIIRGEIAAYKLYEDELTLAFLDIHPLQSGHTLVIPKVEVEFVWDLPEEAYQALMATTLKVAKRLREVLEVPYVGERIVGVDVPHAHVQLIPFHDAGELAVSRDMDSEPDHQALAALAEKLAFK